MDGASLLIVGIIQAEGLQAARAAGLWLRPLQKMRVFSAPAMQ